MSPNRPGAVSIDTRTLQPGDTYVALRGERLDGHAFVPAALEAGAAHAIVEESQRLSLLQRCGLPSHSDRLIGVPDTLLELQRLARRARRAWGGPLIAVTGSAGKTTTKDMIAAVLATRMRVLKTSGNLNNHIGVPLTLLRLTPGDEVAVVEMGMNHAGEIARLAELSEPDVGVFTNVGSAHIGNLGSIEAIAAAKRELADAIATRTRAAGAAPAGVRRPTLILNADDPYVRRFGEDFPGEVLYYSGAGDRRTANAAAALVTGRHFGIPEPQAHAALDALAPGAGRGEIISVGGLTLINDCYNANPEAMAYMLDVLVRTPGRRHLAVLGEMRELGTASEALHRELGTRVAATAAAHGLEAVMAVGGEARWILEGARAAGFGGTMTWAAGAEAAAVLLLDALRPADTVLFKASRAVHLETALERVREHWARA